MSIAGGPHLIGIGGPSCAGKTQLAKWLSERLEAPILNLDHYYVDMAELPIEVRAKRNFDEPAALEHELIFEHARRLAAGEPVRTPRYDFATHTRAVATEVIVPRRFVILEGLFALYWEPLRSLLHTRIFVSASNEVCLDRRLARDVIDRGRTPESVRWQFSTTVQPMAQLHILPTAAFADLVLSGVEPIDSLGQRALSSIERSTRGMMG